MTPKVTLVPKRRPVPRWVAKQYGGSHGFRKEKRAQLKDAARALGRLNVGSAYFPGGSATVHRALEAVRELQQRLSVKEWGS